MKKHIARQRSPDRISISSDSEQDDPTPSSPKVRLPNALPQSVSSPPKTGKRREHAISGRPLALRPADIARLEPKIWFNDLTMDFGLSQFFRRHQLSDRALNHLWVFSTHFYSTLREKGFDEIKRWSRRWDVFAQDLIVVPVHQAYHWSIVLICNPSAAISTMANANQPPPIIVSMDSLGSHQGSARQTVEDWFFRVAEPKLHGSKWRAPESRSLPV
ncbi:hypothetical protein M422DRAFT_258432 [Sphaerobolus stellatus SS14]|uniref:Unplaced genomic scaffold SPHSTscaffold_82, whole genome shotgun sequence n=1 Tax=Sphaerobolus stellatus (strain SS14) TaxID=990650 RepID=A0A0C9UVC5_SPHS4|nr:hypothetical protein M422DRAFT_258432 [Sphaerobolus stellatus SS14]